MSGARLASLEDVELAASIAAAAFTNDPLMSWVFPEPSTRRDQLTVMFGRLVRSFLPDQGTLHLVEDASVSMWRAPGFDHDAPGGDDGPMPFADDVIQRFIILGAAMSAAHPHEAHWYLNVLGTEPSRQGQGLGARTLAPILETCDRDHMPAYLESSNARNIPFYRRQGFVQTGEIPLPDGPSLYPMWREPR